MRDECLRLSSTEFDVPKEPIVKTNDLSRMTSIGVDCQSASSKIRKHLAAYYFWCTLHHNDTNHAHFNTLLDKGAPGGSRAKQDYHGTREELRG